jgi:hypothetical protein
VTPSLMVAGPGVGIQGPCRGPGAESDPDWTLTGAKDPWEKCLYRLHFYFQPPLATERTNHVHLSHKNSYQPG